MAVLESDDPPGKTTRTPYARAVHGYDPEFRHILTEQIITAIARASALQDAPIVAIRTSETLDALSDALITMLALVPDMDVPSKLREAAENLARRVRREVARARAEGLGDRLGVRHEGHA
jgi:hypothetical protein